MSVSQNRFRFGVNDGTESTHTWYAALNTSPSPGTIPLDTTFLLRCGFKAAGAGINNIDVEYQYNLNSAGWINITTTSNVVRAVSTSVFANGANATHRLQQTSGTFDDTNAGCTHDGTAGGNSMDIATDGFSEAVCSMQIRSADVTGGDILTLRTVHDGGTEWTVVSSISLTIPHTPAPAPHTFTLAGTASALALAFGLTTGTIGFTGPAPEPQVTGGGSTTIDVPSGSLLFKGPARNLTDTAISPDTGILRFGGPEIHTRTLVPPRAVLAFTGIAPESRAGLTLEPDAGALTFTGQTTGNVFRGPDTGTLALTGYIPQGPEEGGLIEPVPVGVLDIAGVAPALSHGIGRVPSAAALTFTGQAPDGQRTYLVEPANAALTLTGTVPPLDEALPIPAGALVLTGEVPDGQRTYRFEPPARDLHLTSFPALLAPIGGDSPTIGVDPALLILTGPAPGVGVDSSIPAGTLMLAGLAPGLDLGYVPAAGSLVLAGLAPNAPPGTATQPDAGVLTLTGYAPSLAFVFVVDTGTLTLTGYAPVLPFRAEPTDQVLLAQGPNRKLKAGHQPQRKLLSAVRRR